MQQSNDSSQEQAEIELVANHHNVRQVEEWMILCQQHHQLEAQGAVLSNQIDWTEAARAYPNLAEASTFITRNKESTQLACSSSMLADPQLLQGTQLEAYQIVNDHFIHNEDTPLRMVVTGTAGTGKSFLIACLKQLLSSKVRVSAPTGVAAFNVQGCTLHSLLQLPTKGDFKDLQGESLNKLQQSLNGVTYFIIDEMSMVGRKLMGQVDSRLRQAFPSCANQVLGGRSCILFGDFGQLPPVFDLPLFTTTQSSKLSDLGRTAYQSFSKAVVLTRVMRQTGQDLQQIRFRNILLRLRDAKVTLDDWEELMTRTSTNVPNLEAYHEALHLYPTIDAVADHNLVKLQQNGHSIAVIKAVHSGHNAAKGTSDDAGGLEPVIHLAKNARVMLISNLWVEAGLVNGAMGTVKAICYSSDEPPALPTAVMVTFDSYSGPTLSDGSVPIVPIRRTWGQACSRIQLPLKLAWAITIHKSQGLTLDKAVINVGKREFSTGLTFVACSRLRKITDLVFHPGFDYQCLASLSNSSRLYERQAEDIRLHAIYNWSKVCSSVATYDP